MQNLKKSVLYFSMEFLTQKFVKKSNNGQKSLVRYSNIFTESNQNFLF